jgi:hypothetical protein
MTRHEVDVLRARRAVQHCRTWPELVKLLAVTLPHRVKIDLQRDPGADLYSLRLSHRVPERDTGSDTVVALHRFVEDADLESGAWRGVELVYTAARDLLIHDLDEGFYVDGVRVFDPHALYEDI